MPTLLAAFAVVVSAFGGVRADWRSYGFHSEHKRYDCAPALQAVDAVLTAIDARDVQKGCSWNYGVRATFKALAPAESGALEADWRRANLQVQLGDVRACNVFVEVLDRLFDSLPVREVNQTVFCQPGTSFVSAQFSYLSE